MHLCVCDILSLSGFPLGTCKVMVADAGGQEVKKLAKQGLQPKYPHFFFSLSDLLQLCKQKTVAWSTVNLTNYWHTSFYNIPIVQLGATRQTLSILSISNVK